MDIKKGRAHVLKKSVKIEGTKIQGYDFNQGVNYDKLLDSFLSTGFQASHFAQAIELIKKMRKEKCTIYLGYTSNMVSSGLRDVFRYLAEHKLVDVIVTSAGGVEEDFVKCVGPFILGDFKAQGAALRAKGINRTGNIFVPNERYIQFEQWLLPILTDVAKTKGTITPSELIDVLGSQVNNKESIYYWCHKNNIPVFCPALLDGSLGDMIYFFRYKHPELKIEITDDQRKLNAITFDAKKTGVIILGAGVIKHAILNTNLLRNGCDYAVYVNTSQEFDGSDAGASPDEAVSWGKILPKASSVKVFGDATLLFPLMVARAFAK